MDMLGKMKGRPEIADDMGADSMGEVCRIKCEQLGHDRAIGVLRA